METMEALAQNLSKLTEQMEDLRRHLGLDTPLIPYFSPLKPEAIPLDQLPQIQQSKASFTLDGPGIDLTGQAQKELIGEKDAVVIYTCFYRDNATGRTIHGQAASHLPFIQAVPDETVTQFFSPVTSPERWKILRSLHDSDKRPAELLAETQLTTGQFYHHLRELREHHFIVQEQKTYRLTKLGLAAYLTMGFFMAIWRETIKQGRTDW